MGLFGVESLLYRTINRRCCFGYDDMVRDGVSLGYGYWDGKVEGWGLFSVRALVWEGWKDGFLLFLVRVIGFLKGGFLRS